MTEPTYPDEPLPPVPTWEEPVPQSSLFMRPTTPLIDPWRRTFDCGSDRINTIIRRATWFEGLRSPVRCIQFGTDRAVVGYIVMGRYRVAHPTRLSKTMGWSLYLDTMGVSVDFRGPDPAAREGERYSDVILRHVVEVMAPAYPDIVSILAITQRDNKPARDLLERAKFELDRDPGFDDEIGVPSVLYRLPLPVSDRS